MTARKPSSTFVDSDAHYLAVERKIFEVIVDRPYPTSQIGMWRWYRRWRKLEYQLFVEQYGAHVNSDTTEKWIVLRDALLQIGGFW